MSRVLTTGVAAAAAVLLAACGGDADDTTAPAATRAATAPAGQGFCEQAAGTDERVEAALADLGDASLTDVVRELAADLRSVEPPAAIAGDWDTLAGGLDRLADSLADVDLTDPGSLTALEDVAGDLDAASDRVDAYLRDECGTG
ncbi:hypothetical protein SAMN05660464_0793 [Geodermatophilus dictyosporus]|uniref:Uncharacterized protein n=1 Tax=Geodermatophilus dictyosporus TaxID=1523247 RepID=A0A1I5JIY0_9ACTN|nr:hypothetical protein [Geodermatophilus dictyosporus]SFO72778.1 hypothetical protein SAMN05660464_0793 [Geodermatophilus dictyosporus]